MDSAAFLAAVASARDEVTSRHHARLAGLDDAAISRLVRRDVWRRLHRGVFWTCPQEGPPPLRTRLTAARLAAGGGVTPAGVVVGRGAVELWGLPQLDLAQRAVELVVDHAHRRARAGLCFPRTILGPADVCRHGGFPVTTALRTTRDAAAGRSFDDALVLADAALRLGLAQPAALAALTRLGRAAARAMTLADGLAESPFESRVRAELVEAGLPHPVLQHVVSAGGGFLGRVDLAWPEARLAVEADGASVHATAAALRADLRRQNLILAAGWQVLRFTWADLGRIAPVVRAALAAAAVHPEARFWAS